MAVHRRVGVQVFHEPVFELVDVQALRSLSPEVGGQLGHEQALVARLELVLAAVAQQPPVHNALVEGGTVDRLARQAFLFQAVDLFGDEGEGEGAFSQLL